MAEIGIEPTQPQIYAKFRRNGGLSGVFFAYKMLSVHFCAEMTAVKLQTHRGKLAD